MALDACVTGWLIKGWSTEKNNQVFERSFKWIKETVSAIRTARGVTTKIIIMTHYAPCTAGTCIPHLDGKQDVMWSGFQTDVLSGEGVPGLQKEMHGSLDIRIIRAISRSMEYAFIPISMEVTLKLSVGLNELWLESPMLWSLTSGEF
jgi:predicted phosphohydrolase